MTWDTILKTRNWHKGGLLMANDYDPKYPDTTESCNNDGNPGVRDPYGYDEDDNGKDD